MGSHWVYAVFSSEALSGLCGVWNIELQEKKKKKTCNLIGLKNEIKYLSLRKCEITDRDVSREETPRSHR